MRPLVIGLAVLGALAAAAIVMEPEEMRGPCSVAQGQMMLPELPEASGLAVGRRDPTLIWAHNDSGNAPMLFAVDASGTMRGRVRLPIDTRDWESLAAARCPRGNCLYIGDIGDNDLERRNIRIYRVAEPSPSDTQTATPEMFSVNYPDGRHNAEAMFVTGSDLFVITRDRVGGVYRARTPARGTRQLLLQRIGELGVAAVSDAGVSPDGSVVAVRTPDALYFYRTPDLNRGGTIQALLRVSLAPLQEPQGEGVALGSDGTVYLASEGRAWNRSGRMVVLRCTLPE